MIFQSAVQCIPRIRLQVPGSGTLLAPSSPCPHLPASPVLLQSSIRDSLSSNLLDLKPLALFHMLLCLTVNVFKTVHSHVDMLLAVSFFVRIARSSAERYQLSDVIHNHTYMYAAAPRLCDVMWREFTLPSSRRLNVEKVQVNWKPL
jgi:hypothetical protein